METLESISKNNKGPSKKLLLLPGLEGIVESGKSGFCVGKQFCGEIGPHRYACFGTIELVARPQEPQTPDASTNLARRVFQTLERSANLSVGTMPATRLMKWDKGPNHDAKLPRHHRRRQWIFRKFG